MKAKVKTQVLVVWLSLKISGKGDLQSCKWHVLRSCVIIYVSLPVYGRKYMKENSRTSSKALHVTLHSYVIVMFYDALIAHCLVALFT
jgi:hypothetical protein